SPYRDLDPAFVGLLVLGLVGLAAVVAAALLADVRERAEPRAEGGGPAPAPAEAFGDASRR
ncbi:hypothetical protein ACH5WX_11520, partial [Nocardioides sp. CER28]